MYLSLPAPIYQHMAEEKYTETVSKWESERKKWKSGKMKRFACSQNHFDHRISFENVRVQTNQLNQPNDDNDSVSVHIWWKKGERIKEVVFFDFYTWSWFLMWWSPSKFFFPKNCVKIQSSCYQMAHFVVAIFSDYFFFIGCFFGLCLQFYFSCSFLFTQYIRI